MPPVKAKKNDSGIYDTKGLSESQFIAAFNRIKTEQNKARRNARKTLKPAALTRRTTQDIARLGEKADGTPFTGEDLKRFEKMSKKFSKRRGSTQGITYLEVVAKGRAIDVNRASNRVGDGSGITTASLIGIRKGNIAHIRVKASSKSKHQEHMVRVRFEEWDHNLRNAGEYSDDKDDGYVAAAKHSCRGRVSFDCDCGRYQYWYRYLATIGNYQLSPPKEFAYTKIRNPNLIGVACKHITKTMAMLQSPAWHRPLAAQMRIQATRTGYGDDHRNNAYLTKEEQKAASKNRKLTVNQDKARAEYKKYLSRQAALKRKLKENPEANKANKELLKKTKKVNAQLSKENAALKRRNAELERAARDSLKLRISSFIDTAKLAGVSEKKAIAAFAKANKLDESTVIKVRGK